VPGAGRGGYGAARGGGIIAGRNAPWSRGGPSHHYSFIWGVMKQWNLVLGDALDVLAGLDPSSVDTVITDPPYALPARHFNTRKEFPRSLSDLSILEHFFGDLFGACARVLKPTGCLYVFCDGQSYPAFYATLYRHVRRLMPLVWDKMVSINGYSWRHQHELILYGEMNEAPNVPTGDGDILRCRAVAVGDRTHPAEKPVALLQRLIAKSVPAGGLVLDPFAGSAATGLACLRTGRRFLGVEKDPHYHALGVRSLEGADGPLFAGAAAQAELPAGLEQPHLPALALARQGKVK
jgi:site-specific DNA-methyltransferase (adenine-specific)